MILAAGELPSLWPDRPGAAGRHPTRPAVRTPSTATWSADRDQLMRRTRAPPASPATTSPRHTRWRSGGHRGRGLRFPSGLSVVPALRAARRERHPVHVFVYTIWLKPRTAQNIVIGGRRGRGCRCWSAGPRSRGPSAPRPGCCFASSSSGRRRTSGPLAAHQDDYAAAGIPCCLCEGHPGRGTQIAVYSVCGGRRHAPVGPRGFDGRAVRGPGRRLRRRLRRQGAPVHLHYDAHGPSKLVSPSRNAYLASRPSAAVAVDTLVRAAADPRRRRALLGLAALGAAVVVAAVVWAVWASVGSGSGWAPARGRPLRRRSRQHAGRAPPGRRPPISSSTPSTGGGSGSRAAGAGRS